ncbi:double-strand break repair helicase AddA [Sphingomonas prati]|uniref:DNA 3'-5' helicase n=1 Tax=Sphingomonas prati TaxID=1843237 RepID=A0A7W9BSU5_9SPHN|nr:double-strand break repair helicase AddA [Sphingomonas prati]MBB5729480.1 ATP-dependent helicase/nuclease subunit A [Sphingomonas prati]GGE77077.1 double-strand break repair helicase AddA [Sphingomonas prati]
MAHRFTPLIPLKGDQLRASDPDELVWLSASAGTGKTHVLTARVLRLLLSGVDPAAILCLTFTKAGAAEMADRIHGRLAAWVRLDDAKLRKELYALDEPHLEDSTVAKARTLFARVLEAAGGGLRIQTIHAFCQTLLAGFPAEAGLTPGFRPIEGREEGALARRVLAEMLVAAEREGDLGLIRDVQTLSRRLGEGAAEAYLMECTRAPDALAELGARSGIEARLRAALDVPVGDVEEAIAAACADDQFDVDALFEISEANGNWGTKTALARADRIAAWLAGDLPARAAGLTELHQVWAKADGEPRSFAKGQAPQTPGYAETAMLLHAWCGGLLRLRAGAALAALVGAGLRAGQTYALLYAAAKRRAGLVDFDDLIRTTVKLLTTDGMGDWVRYKLDRQTDHILVDEAQDTNTDQWTIVAMLAGEYFAGEGARPNVRRTIFTVGDFKQAIFGFQGTNPQAFAAARLHFERHAVAAERKILALSLDQSFRSTPPVLELVDRLIGDLGADTLGLGPDHVTERHASFKGGPGTVTLLRPHSADEGDPADDAGEESWVDDATRAFATRLARQIREWLDEGLMLESRGRALRPEDILILVRKRGTLASLIVARLHAEGVAVAGVDRLRLDAPLAVRDLLAAARFAVQPEDDLTLASLLVSPLFGWSQQALYDVGFGRAGSLRQAVRETGDAATQAGLSDLLARADYETPFRFLDHILTGPLDGQRRLVGRLGEEARDPIQELLGAALAFEDEATPTLQGFLDWFDRGEVTITRDPSAPSDAVRVMTVHGSKGLQAPMVILADATTDPELAPRRSIKWALGEAGPVPVFRPRKAELAGSLADDMASEAQREREEHWRLLYVAMTRAEERLVIGGALGVRAKGVPPERSWYAAIGQAMAGLGATPVVDAIWGEAHHHRGTEPAAARKAAAPRVRPAPPVLAEPGWLRRAAPEEARPPRPLAPSSIGLDAVSDPPPVAAMRAAAERGRLLHALFERLPAVAPGTRMAAADRWLAQSGGVADPVERTALLTSACRIVDDPGFAEIFGPDALAEAPIAAVVDGVVVAGTVDRLLVRPDGVRIVDFKTARRVPGGIDAVPRHHIEQMAAYVAAVGVVFPGRPVSAALLYTGGPTLFELSPELLAAHKQAFVAPEQKQQPVG